jgi:hypothetical protein
MRGDPSDVSRLFKEIEKRLQRLERAVFPPAPSDPMENARWIADQLDAHLARKAQRPGWEPQIESKIVMALFELQAALTDIADIQRLSLGPCTADDDVRRIVVAMRGLSETGEDLNPTDWDILAWLAERGEGSHLSLNELLSKLARRGNAPAEGTLRSRLPALVGRGYLSKRKRGKGGGGYCMTPKAWWTLRAHPGRSIKTN